MNKSKNPRDRESMTADDSPYLIAKRGLFVAGTDALSFMLIYCRVFLLIIVTALTEHYI